MKNVDLLLGWYQGRLQRSEKGKGLFARAYRHRVKFRIGRSTDDFMGFSVARTDSQSTLQIRRRCTSPPHC